MLLTKVLTKSGRADELGPKENFAATPAQIKLHALGFPEATDPKAPSRPMLSTETPNSGLQTSMVRLSRAVLLLNNYMDQGPHFIPQLFKVPQRSHSADHPLVDYSFTALHSIC